MVVTTLARLNRNVAIACDSTARMERAAARTDFDALPSSIVAHALECRALYRRAWTELDEGADDEDSLQEAGESVRSAFQEWLDLLTRTAQDCNGHGSHAEVNDAIQELSRLLASLERDWPWKDRPWLEVDPKMVEASRAAIARGEYQDAEDLIRELESKVQMAGA
jgi:hypothetical protein